MSQVQAEVIYVTGLKMLVKQLYGLYEQELWSSVVRFGAILLKMNANQNKCGDAAASDAVII